MWPISGTSLGCPGRPPTPPPKTDASSWSSSELLPPPCGTLLVPPRPPAGTPTPVAFWQGLFLSVKVHKPIPSLRGVCSPHHHLSLSAQGAIIFHPARNKQTQASHVSWQADTLPLMHCQPHCVLSLWARRQPGAWWERQIDLGSLECLCVPSHRLLFSGRVTECGGKSSSYAEQLSYRSQNACTELCEMESHLCGSSAHQPASLRAFWIRTVSAGRPECSGGPGGEVPGHCLMAVPSGLSPVTIPPIKC